MFMSLGVITRVATLRHRFTASLHHVILLVARNPDRSRLTDQASQLLAPLSG
jgi:hypothetical protein